ncbi:MAG: K(+)-transporting ATPase subunit C [Verrucomicrobiales bacterium]|nr:K(+)-transporting ATPase subunit C [Verrucomicrobiales bacterium]
MKHLIPDLRAATAATLSLVFLCCGVYPLAVYALAQLAFPSQANGSLIRGPDGTVLGSELVGQGFTQLKYFHPRPSAAGANGYDATSSGGANLGPTSRTLHDAIQHRAELYRAENGLAPTAVIPADAVTASASGLDPHISPRNAELQSDRIARARGWTRSQVLDLIHAHLESPSSPFRLGEPRVNVLRLNLALDSTTPKP